MGQRFHRGFTAAEKKKTGVIRCHTRRSIAVYLYKPAACSRKSCLAIFDRSARCVAPSRPIRMAIGGGISRISSQSVSNRRRLKIGRCLAIGKAISCPGRTSYIATLVERHTRYVMLAKVAGKDTQTVVSALIKQAKTLPKELYKSLTWDRGKELTDHRRFTLATNIDWSCHAAHSCACDVLVCQASSARPVARDQVPGFGFSHRC